MTSTLMVIIYISTILRVCVVFLNFCLVQYVICTTVKFGNEKARRKIHVVCLNLYLVQYEIHIITNFGEK